jgi:lysophospholipase L1-like esterase
MQIAPPSSSRFDQWPAWQRAATLALTVLGICLVLVLVAEVGFRIRALLRYGQVWSVEQTYAYDEATGLRIPMPGGRFGPISINSLGFRGPEITQKKPPGRLRIAFLGGSTTYCAEVSSNEMTWPHLVWKALHDHWPGLDLDYINAGVPGYTTESLLRAVERRVARLEPDIIVIYEATNDFHMNIHQLAIDQGISSIEPFERGRNDIGWLARHSFLARLIRANLRFALVRGLATGNSGKMKLDTARLDAEFRRNYTNLVEASAKIAKVVVTVTFASRLRDQHSPTEQIQSAPPYTTIDDIITGLAHYNQVIREIANVQQTLLVGGEETIPPDRLHYADDVHFTDAGSIAMAHRVVEALISSADVQAMVESKTAQSEHTIFN